MNRRRLGRGLEALLGREEGGIEPGSYEGAEQLQVADAEETSVAMLGMHAISVSNREMPWSRRTADCESKYRSSSI